MQIKWISVTPDNGAIIFKKREVNLFDLKADLKCSYYGSKKFKAHKSISGILAQHEKEKDLLESKAFFKIFKYDKFI